MNRERSVWNALSWAIVLAAVPLALGCDGSSSGGKPATETVTGVVQGRSFQSKASGFAQVAPSALWLNIPDFEGMCQAVGGPDGDAVWLTIFTCINSAAPAGDYQVQPGGGTHVPCSGTGAWAEVRSSLGGTYSSTPVDSGMVSIKTSTAQDLAGSVTLTIGADSVAGSFSASYCASLDLSDP